MNIFEEIEQRNRSNTSKTALTIRLKNDTARTYTYGQMFETIALYQQVLERAHIKPGDRIAIASESMPEWTIVYLALAGIHATSVLLDASLDAQDLLDLLDRSDVRCFFASPSVLEKLNDAAIPPAFNLLLNPQTFLDAPSPTLRTSLLPGREDAASIIFSSGTTKKASGILHSHKSLICSTQMCINSTHLKAEDRFLAILPNSHIYGLVCQLLGPLLLGAPTCFIDEMTSVALVGAFQNFHPTILPAVPKIYELLKTQILQKINGDEKTKKTFEAVFPLCLKIRQTIGLNLGLALFKAVHQNFGGKLRILCSAGAPITSETAAFFYGLGFDMLITYGATETGIPTIGNLPGQITTDTCGKPYPDISVKLSETGEILLRTPYRMLAYFNDPQATAAAFDADGWFYSGDLGRVDDKGLVHILGRCKENIVLANGKKIAPDDIETAYGTIEGVKEFVICGIPVAEGGYDEVHAFVIAEVGQDESAIAHLKKRSADLSQNQKLVGIHLVDEIPKTSLQKPKRFLLKQMILNDQTPHLDAQPNTDLPSTVRSIIARVSGTSDFTTDSQLFEDLAIDSLGALDLACEISDRCGVTVEHLLHKNMTVAELISCVVSPIIGQQPVLENPYPKRKNKLAYQVFSFGRNLIRGFYRVKINNDSVLPSNSGYIICANHVSNFDYLYLTLNFTKERFSKFCCMAKKELFRNNFFCNLITNIGGMIPVDRDGIVSDTMSAIQSKLSDKWGVLIHPEGTRSQTGQLGSFKNGAAVLAIEADVPIVPAYIKGGYEVFPCQKKLPSLFNWKKMCKYQVDVIYGEPIFPGGRSPEELMTAIKTAVTALATPVVRTTPQA